MNILELYSSLLNSKERFLDEVFEKEIYAEIKPKLTIVDLGAYQGEFCFYCLPFAEKLYAVEPDPRPFEVMQRTIEKYGIRNIRTFPFAIHGQNGHVKFFPSGYGGATVVGDDHRAAEDIIVPTKTLNTFLTEEGIESVDILKIDVESSEESIFSAPDFAEASKKIKQIIGEGHNGEAVKPLLAKHGFKVEFINGNTFYAHK